VRGWLTRRCLNLLNYAFDILHHIIVPEPPQPKTFCLNDRRTSLIIGFRFRPDMGFAIQLNRQPGLGTEEIDNIGTKPDLLPELQPRNLPIAEMSPKPFLGLGWFTA